MIKKRLYDLRIEFGLTQEQLSEIVNISRQSYAKYEDGAKPPIDVLIALSDYYNVSLDYLIGISDIRERLYLDPKIQEFINDCLDLYYKHKDILINDYKKSKE